MPIRPLTSRSTSSTSRVSTSSRPTSSKSTQSVAGSFGSTDCAQLQITTDPRITQPGQGDIVSQLGAPIGYTGESSGSSNAGPIAGGVVGGLAAVVAVVALALWAICRRRKRRRDRVNEEETIGRPYSRYTEKEVGGTFEPTVHPVTATIREGPRSPRLAPLDVNSPFMPLLQAPHSADSPASTISMGPPPPAGVVAPSPISASYQRTSTYRPATTVGSGTFGAMSLASGSLVGEQSQQIARMFEEDDRDAKTRLLEETGDGAGGLSNFVALGSNGGATPPKDDAPAPVSTRPPSPPRLSAVEPTESPFADVPRPRPRARSLPTTNRPEIDPAPFIDAPPAYV